MSANAVEGGIAAAGITTSALLGVAFANSGSPELGVGVGIAGSFLSILLGGSLGQSIYDHGGEPGNGVSYMMASLITTAIAAGAYEITIGAGSGPSVFEILDTAFNKLQR